MRATASKVGLLAYCQAWARPDAVWVDRPGPAAERGTRFHRAIALYAATVGGMPLTVEDDIAQEFERAKAWFDGLGVGRGSANVRVETAYAWDPVTDTAEVLGTDRDYSKGGHRLCGTADLVILVVVDGRVIAAMVWDYKTGSGLDAGPQLRGLGLMVARAYSLDSVTVAALEVRKSGVTEVAREELDAFALASVAGELAEQIAAIATAEPAPGSHCGELYCPARLSCPLGTMAMAQVIPADALTAPRQYKLTDPIKTPEHAAWALDVARLVAARCEAIKDEIKSLVPAEGWPLADGRVLREGQCETSAFDKHKALALCKQLGATDEQIASLTYTFQKSTGLRVTGGTAKPRTKRSKAA